LKQRLCVSLRCGDDQAGKGGRKWTTLQRVKKTVIKLWNQVKSLSHTLIPPSPLIVIIPDGKGVHWTRLLLTTLSLWTVQESFDSETCYAGISATCPQLQSFPHRVCAYTVVSFETLTVHHVYLFYDTTILTKDDDSIPILTLTHRSQRNLVSRMITRTYLLLSGQCEVLKSMCHVGEGLFEGSHHMSLEITRKS